MKRKFFIIIFILFNVLITKGQNPTIDITKFYTIGNSIIVEYELKNFSSTKKINTELYFEKKSNGTTIKCESDALSGDVGDLVDIEGKKEIVWDLSKDDIELQEEIRPIIYVNVEETSNLKNYMFNYHIFDYECFFLTFEYCLTFNKITLIDYKTKDIVFNQFPVSLQSYRMKINIQDDETYGALGLEYSYTELKNYKKIQKGNIFANLGFNFPEIKSRLLGEIGYGKIITSEILNLDAEKEYNGWHLGLEYNYSVINFLCFKTFLGINQGNNAKLTYLFQTDENKNLILKSNFYFGVGVQLFPVFLNL